MHGTHQPNVYPNSQIVSDQSLQTLVGLTETILNFISRNISLQQQCIFSLNQLWNYDVANCTLRFMSYTVIFTWTTILWPSLYNHVDDNSQVNIENWVWYKQLLLNSGLQLFSCHYHSYGSTTNAVWNLSCRFKEQADSMLTVIIAT